MGNGADAPLEECMGVVGADVEVGAIVSQALSAHLPPQTADDDGSHSFWRMDAMSQAPMIVRLGTTMCATTIIRIASTVSSCSIAPIIVYCVPHSRLLFEHFLPCY